MNNVNETLSVRMVAIAVKTVMDRFHATVLRASLESDVK